MKKFLLISLLLALVFTFAACGNNDDEEAPFSPVTPWVEAEVDADAFNLGDDFALEEFDLAEQPLDDLFGEDLGDWTADDFGLGTLPALDNELEDMGFDFGTPLETGNEFDTELPIETGMVLETGTHEFDLPVEVAAPIVHEDPPETNSEPDYLPLEVDDDALEQYIEEELNQPAEDLPKTNDMVTGLSVAIGGVAMVVLMLFAVKKKRVQQ